MSDSASSAELRELYRELILDHARRPRHFGKLVDATHSAEGINPLCGDKLKLYLKLANDGHIEDATFEGTGCAISVASASLLTDTVVGCDVEDALCTKDRLLARLTSEHSSATHDPMQQKLMALEGVKDFPSRVKCATLAWHALAAAIRRAPQAATTE